MKNTFKWVGMAIVTVAAMSATASNTIQGAGQDIESAGKTIEDAANQALGSIKIIASVHWTGAFLWAQREPIV